MNRPELRIVPVVSGDPRPDLYASLADEEEGAEAVADSLAALVALIAAVLLAVGLLAWVTMP